MGQLETIDLQKVIKKELITVDLQATTKEGVIYELTDILYEGGCLTDKEAFIKDVLLREEEGATGLGNGIAIPHGKSGSVLKTRIAVGISKNDIPWESLDDKPVNTIILFAVQDSDANTTHILLLQQVAIFLADEDFLERLKKARSEEEVIELFTNNKK